MKRRRARIAELTEQIAFLRRQIFGRRRETIDLDQLALFESMERELLELTKSTKPMKKKQGHGRTLFPADLPRETITVDLPEADQICPDWGDARKHIGIDAIERGHIIPARMSVKRYERHKYACSKGHAVKVAPLPDGVVDRGKYEASVYAFVATSKYADHCVPRRHAHKSSDEMSVPCCTEDEGRPLEIGVQAPVSNRLELRGSRAQVVSVEGKGAARLRQVRSKETNASEPLMTCREVFTQRQNRAGWLARDESRGYLSTDWMAFGMKVA